MDDREFYEFIQQSHNVFRNFENIFENFNIFSKIPSNETWPSETNVLTPQHNENSYNPLRDSLLKIKNDDVSKEFYVTPLFGGLSDPFNFFNLKHGDADNMLSGYQFHKSNNDLCNEHISHQKIIQVDSFGNEKITVIKQKGDKIEKSVTIRHPDGTITTEENSPSILPMLKSDDPGILNKTRPANILKNIENNVTFNHQQPEQNEDYHSRLIKPKPGFLTNLLSTLWGNNDAHDKNSEFMPSQNQPQNIFGGTKDSKLKYILDKFF